MNLPALVASFRGGIIGAYMGAPPAFILTGVIVIAGVVVVMAGGVDVAIRFIAFGSCLDPYITPTGGVATSAHAGKTKKLGSGTDILSYLSGLADPATLLVGGVFGVTGFLIHYVIGTALHPNTDPPGFIVIISAVIAHPVFGSSGLIGKAAPSETREHFTGGKGMLCNVIPGLSIRTTTGFVYQALADDGASAASTSSYPVPCFGAAAVSLTSIQIGSAMSTTHHTVLISAPVTVTVQNFVMGTVLGILTSLFGDSIGKTFNNCCDTYVDPPIFTIFIFVSTVNVLFESGFFGA